VAIVNGYVTRADVQNALGLGTATLVPDSEEIDQVVTAVSRTIDDYCGRFFYSVAGTVTFTADDYLFLPIGDWSSVTSVKTDENNDGTCEVTLTSGTRRIRSFPDGRIPRFRLRASDRIRSRSA